MTNPLQAIDDAIVKAESLYDQLYLLAKDPENNAHVKEAKELITNLKAAREAFDSEEMAEKVAKVIYEFPNWFKDDPQWKDVPPSHYKRHLIEQAKAAIAAVKGERDDS